MTKLENEEHKNKDAKNGKRKTKQKIKMRRKPPNKHTHTHKTAENTPKNAKAVEEGNTPPQAEAFFDQKSPKPQCPRRRLPKTRSDSEAPESTPETPKYSLKQQGGRQEWARWFPKRHRPAAGSEIAVSPPPTKSAARAVIPTQTQREERQIVCLESTQKHARHRSEDTKSSEASFPKRAKQAQKRAPRRKKMHGQNGAPKKLLQMVQCK